jgi:hypothetical protein
VKAYRSTPEDRTQIPEGIKQPSAVWTIPETGDEFVDYGIMNCGITDDTLRNPCRTELLMCRGLVWISAAAQLAISTL